METDEERRERLASELPVREEAIRSREDLIAFIDLLIEAFEAEAVDFHYLPDYLVSLSMSVGGVKQLCKNLGMPYPLRPGWRWIGRQLYAAAL